MSTSRSRRCSATSLPAGLSDVSWILDVYAIVLAGLLLSAGRAADRIGRPKCFLAGLVVFGVASLGCAVAPDLLALIACRALQAAASIAPGPITAGIVSTFSGRLSARFGVRGTVVAGAALFAAAPWARSTSHPGMVHSPL